MRDKPGTIIAVISDTHIASTTGLCLPQWTIQGAKADESLVVQASAAANWIYESWREYWAYVAHLAGVIGKRRKHRVVSIHVGDIVEGIHHDTKQIMLPDLGDQVDMGSEIMTQIANLSDGGIWACHGTPAHAGDLYQVERAVAQRAGFKALEPELHLDIDGLIVWAFHHGAAGKRDWSSTAARIATESRLYAQDLGEPPPNYVFTGHHHIIDDSGVKLETQAMTCPSWQLKTSFGQKVASNRRSDIGGYIVLPGGQLDTSRARYKAHPGQPTTRRV